jgi:uncharacterized membrane protein
LFLMLVPVGIAGLRRLPHLQDAAIVCGVGYLGWLALIASSASFVQTRLLFPIFPLLAVIAAGGFDWLRQSEALTIGVQRLVSAAVAVSLLLSALGLTLEFGASGVTAVLSGDQPRQDYLVDRLGWYALAMDSINRLPAGSQVMFLWEPRSLYCRIDCRPDAMLDRWWHARRTIGSPDAIAQAWRAAGVTHVLLHRAGYQFFASAEFDPISADDQAALASLIGAHLSLAQDFDGVYELYSLRPEK